MTLAEFTALDDHHQQLALRNAVCVADKREGDYHIYLFQFSNFYVEVFFHNKLHQVGRYRAFRNTNELQPYLPNIKVVFRKKRQNRILSRQ